MKEFTAEIEVRGELLRFRWDMRAIATFEDLTDENAIQGIAVNARNLLVVLWAAYDADAASRDEYPAISYRRFGSYFSTEEEIAQAMQIASQIIVRNEPDLTEAKKKQDPPKAARPNRSQRRAATRSARSTSDSATASTGG